MLNDRQLDRLGKRVSLREFVGSRDEFMKNQISSTLVKFGFPHERADRLAQEAIDKAKTSFDDTLPDVTKHELETIKIRRYP